ncbi:MAG TPA: N-acetylneuraminate lyase [Planctomycetes bacterium]|nr:N-acetylneuraminate lyase [Planctomycetota bacterium]
MFEARTLPGEPLSGLVAAPHTPFDAAGDLDLSVVEGQARHLADSGVTAVFAGGSTGEFSSLTGKERFELHRRWLEVGPAHNLKVVIHCGSNCQRTLCDLAGAAEEGGADAIAAVAPHYLRPASSADLAAYFAPVSVAAVATPFYYYDIPALTGVPAATAELLEMMAKEVPTFFGVKSTTGTIDGLKVALAALDGTLDVLHGSDETLLDGLEAGVKGAVGSSYNYAASIYLDIIEAHNRGEGERAQRLQARAAQMIETIAFYGYGAAAKQLMAAVGCPVGLPRPPLRPLDEATFGALIDELRAGGVVDLDR